MQQETDNRSLGELFSKLASDTSLLIRQEIALAKKELSQAVSQALRGAISLVIGAVLAHTGLLALVAAAILALSLVMDAWAAALIVGAVLLILGLILVFVGINRIKQLQIPPPRTTQTLKEDLEMVKEKTR